MQTKLIFLLFTISIFWSFILISPIRFTMNIGSSEMRETDFLIILLVINWFFMRGNNFSKDIHSLIFALVGILIIPIFIAIFDGKI